MVKHELLQITNERWGEPRDESVEVPAPLILSALPNNPLNPNPLPPITRTYGASSNSELSGELRHAMYLRYVRL